MINVIAPNQTSEGIATSCTPAPQLLPVSAIIATLGRPNVLGVTLRTLAAQSAQPQELLIIDASIDSKTALLCQTPIPGLASKMRYFRAHKRGAASQRNEGVRLASQPVIGFFDDDIRFAPNCLHRLWLALDSDTALGGVSAMISNQQYATPGMISRMLFRILHGRSERSYAGRCIGPALNLLPEDDDQLPDVVPVDWLNTTCTLYRREALPTPPFPPIFREYSLMEDVALSLAVAQQWKLANARTAQIIHDSQPGAHKSDILRRARMEVVNRHYVMTKVMRRERVTDYAKFGLLMAFSIASSMRSAAGVAQVPRQVVGIVMGLADILRGSIGRSARRRADLAL